MTQAESNIHSKSVSRRAALAGAVAVASALPSAAMAKDRCSFPDLAAELTAIRERYIKQHKFCKRRGSEGAAHATAQTGLTEAHARECGYESAEWEAWMGAWSNHSEEHFAALDPVDESGNSIEWCAIFDDLYPICEAILARPALSVADLGVKAQAYALSSADYFLDGMDGDKNARVLAEAICTFCAVEAIPGLVVLPLDDLEG